MIFIHCATVCANPSNNIQGLAPEAVVSTIVKVQFQKAGRLYDFLTGELVIQKDDMVIVETDRGKTIGLVIKGPITVPDEELPDGIKTVVRKALPEDLESAANNRTKENEAGQSRIPF
jgi:cell fate regulator YaaT (PSP1 superfamily)